MKEEYLEHDDTEYEILKPENFNKLTPEQQKEVLSSISKNSEGFKRFFDKPSDKTYRSNNNKRYPKMNNSRKDLFKCKFTNRGLNLKNNFIQFCIWKNHKDIKYARTNRSCQKYIYSL